jgi:hypothetical protein
MNRFVKVSAVLCAMSAGCMTRPVTHQEPTTKLVITQPIRQAAVDKIDLLFAIDNSASMGDKQDYLRAAVPDLLDRLVTPSCVDEKGRAVIQNGVPLKTSDGLCAVGKAEFGPVHDLHIGIVSSSLGPRLGTACDPALSPGNDDHGHLLNRAAADGHTVSALQPSNFLEWLPPVAANTGTVPSAGATAVTDLPTLQNDFKDIVAGVNQSGCGIESQLESWYRFLVQPDPYDHLEIIGEKATWVGVDSAILKQRHDFLRPDSLVAIIVLSDENDSEIDVRANSGSGYKFMSTGFEPAHATAKCATDPNDPSCTSCDFLSAAAQAKDPACAARYTAENDWGFDLNLRHVHTKAKYGVDPQFPLSRYVRGLTEKLIPDRTGEYPAGKGAYDKAGANCTNPLFAAQIPDGSKLDPFTLCKLPAGGRSADLVFYAVIGGVPNQLLHFNPDDPSASRLSADDWTKILGKNPDHFDYTGIDPHMIESARPRDGLAPPTSPNGTDPISGREWLTDVAGARAAGAVFSVDRQYACIFPLATPRDCALTANQGACDCPTTKNLPKEQVSPVCDPNDPTKQIAAKAYPTIRELQLAHALGDQGIVSSLCPIDVTEKTPGDPLYGYRPAVAAIVDRLKNVLANVCLPERLEEDGDGNVPCLILETLPLTAGLQATACDAAKGLSQPAPAVLAKFLEGTTAPHGAVCAVAQLTKKDFPTSCVDSSGAGWCYLTGQAAGVCAQAIKFSPAGNPVSGATIALQCIEQVALQ